MFYHAFGEILFTVRREIYLNAAVCMLKIILEAGAIE